MAAVAIVVGVAFRVASLFLMDVRSDGNTYTAMGLALTEHGRFLMPWGDVTTWAPSPPAPSHHYPPVYPAYLAVWYATFGWGIAVTKAAALAASLGALVVVWWVTRDLYGRTPALLTTAVVAAEPHLVWVTGTGFSENVVLALFAGTLWAILKSLDRPPFVLIAGLFAGLAYLTRASMGYFFFVAGAGGFLWRFAYMRWRVFTNGWYLGAAALFLSMVAVWAARNVALFGWSDGVLPFIGTAVRVPNWQTSSYTDFVTGYAFARPAQFLTGLGWKLPLFGAFFVAHTLPFPRETWRSLRALRQESESALWLAAWLVLGLGALFTALFWVYEETSVWWMDNHRYAVIAYVPLTWLVLKRARFAKLTFRWRYAAFIVVLLAIGGFLLVKPVQFPDIRAAEALSPVLEPGDEIAVDGSTIKYAFYAYLPRPGDVTIYGWSSGLDPDYIVTLKLHETYDGYAEFGRYHVTHYDGRVSTAVVWQRAP